MTNEEVRKAIEKYQEKHPLQFGMMLDVTAISSKEGADIISQTIERVSKKVEEDTDLWCICEMAKMYIQGITPVYPAKPQGEWIPIKTRPLTDEERKSFSQYCGSNYEDTAEEWAFDCPMPGDGQEILISTSYGVSTDYCEFDCTDDGMGLYSLEDRGDWDGVEAWMPMPEPYKKEGESE